MSAFLQPDLSDLHPAKLKRGNPPPGSRIGDDVGEIGRILVRGEPGNGIIDDLAPLGVRVFSWKSRGLMLSRLGRGRLGLQLKLGGQQRLH